jgi:hypothetical protein
MSDSLTYNIIYHTDARRIEQSKEFVPIFGAVAEDLQESKRFVFLQFDSYIHNGVIADLGVDVFPSVYVFVQGQSYVYEGKMQKTTLAKYLRTYMSPSWRAPRNFLKAVSPTNFHNDVQSSPLMLIAFVVPRYCQCARCAHILSHMLVVHVTGVLSAPDSSAQCRNLLACCTKITLTLLLLTCRLNNYSSRLSMTSLIHPC